MRQKHRRPDLFRTLVLSAFLLAAGANAAGPKTSPRPTPAELRDVMAKLRPLHRPAGRPRPGEWRSLHREDGQSFRQYLACDPTLPEGQRTVLYIQPLGAFTPEQRRVVERTAEFLGLTFHRPVRVLPDLPLSAVPARARRVHPVERQPQLLTRFIRDELLKPRLPEDAAAFLALTAVDLWPGEGWNFVYGDASLHERVGVWSLARNGDPSKGPEPFHLCLLRTIKTASHETAHMFSLEHCIRYECNMAGIETMEEADRYPLDFCPECLAKLCWATGTQPAEHLRWMAEFCGRSGLKTDEAFFRASLRAIGGRLWTAAHQWHTGHSVAEVSPRPWAEQPQSLMEALMT